MYAIPMRIVRDGLVKSYFSADQLMMSSITLSQEWQANHAAFRYDLNIQDDIRRYVASCTSASEISCLSDQLFHSKVLKDNMHIFGTRIKQKNDIRTSDTLYLI